MKLKHCRLTFPGCRGEFIYALWVLVPQRGYSPNFYLLIVENKTKEGFGKEAQTKFLSLLGEIIRGAVVDVGKVFIITRIEKII